jgi:hypothetical protein
LELDVILGGNLKSPAEEEGDFSPFEEGEDGCEEGANEGRHGGDVIAVTDADCPDGDCHYRRKGKEVEGEISQAQPFDLETVLPQAPG